MTSSRPYLLRAIYEWIADNELTPHIVVDAEAPGVEVPRKYVQDNQIVLNITASAVHKLLVSNDAVEFQARFSGMVHQIYAPISSITAIYAKENGRGMVFHDDQEGGGEGDETPTPSNAKFKKPGLTIVK